MGSDYQSKIQNPNSKIELIGLLPGSKPAKLKAPLALAIAETHPCGTFPNHFVIPVAPTLDVETLASFANPSKSVIHQIGGAVAELDLGERPFSKHLLGCVWNCGRDRLPDLLSSAASA